MDEAQAGIKIDWKNINNLSYADETTLIAESEEKLKGFLMRLKEESEEVGLKLNIQKQRHYFANKGSPSQGYGFSSGHVWM